jgi:hypothetical protein
MSLGARPPRTTRWVLFLCAVLVGPIGCASSHGLSRDSLQDVILREETGFLDPPSAAAAPAPRHAPTLGFYFKPTAFVHREFEWTSRDRDAVLTWAQGLSLGVGGRSTGFLTPSSLKGQSLRELRATAARYGVDWVLVFDGAAAVDRYNNYKAPLLYWTIVGAYLADGTHSDALCLMKATVWDVRSGARLVEELAAAETKSVGPAALVNDQQQIERARTMAMHTLLERLTDRFATLLGTRQ